MRDPLSSLQLRAVFLVGRVEALAWSPDGIALAIASAREIFIADPATGAVRLVGKTQGCRLEWTADGVVAFEDRKSRRIGKHPKRAAAPRGSRERIVRGRVLAFREQNAIAIVDAETEEPIAHHAVTDFNHDVALSPDGTRIVFSGTGGAWEGPCEGQLAFLPEHGPVSHAGTHVAIGSAVYRIGDDAVVVRAPDVQRARVALAPDATRIAVAHDHVVRIYELAALAAAPASVGAIDEVHALAVDHAHDRLAASDRAGRIYVWRLGDAKLVRTFQVTPGEHELAFALDGALLVGTYGVEVWDVEAGRRRTTHRIAGIDEVRGLLVTPRAIAVRTSHAAAVVTPDFSIVRAFGPWKGQHGWDEQIDDLALSPDGTQLGVARDGLPTRVFATVDGALVRELPAAGAIAIGETVIAHSTYTDGALVDREGTTEAIEPFGRAIARGDRFLWINGDRLGIRGRREVVLDTRFASAPRALAAGSDAARFYTAATTWIGERGASDGRLRRVFGAGASEAVRALAFDPSGDRIAVGERDRLSVWRLGAQPRRIGFLDATPLQPAGSIREPGKLGDVQAIAFTASTLVACAAEVMVWDADDLAHIGRVEQRVLANLYITHVSCDGTRLLHEGSMGSDWKLHDAAGTELASGPAAGGHPRFTDLSDDGRRVLTGTASRESRASELGVFDDTGQRLGTLRIEGELQGACFDGRNRVLGWVDSGPFFRWDPVAHTCERWCDPPPIERFNLVAGARRAGRLVVANGSSQIVLQEDTGAIVAQLPNLVGLNPRTVAALSSDGRLLALGGQTGEVRIHDLAASGTPCIAALCGTSEGGWWSIGPDGYSSFPGEATTRDFGAEP